MSTNYNPRTFTSLGLLRSIPAELLLRFLAPHRRFLESQGFAWPDSDDPDSFDHVALHDVLLKPAGPAPDKRLAEAMFIVDEMANPEGVTALVDSIRETHPAFEKPKDVEPAVFVIAQWLENPERVEDTNARRYVRENRSFHSFRADAPLPETGRLAPPQLTQLESAIADRLADAYPRDSVRLHQYPDGKVIRYLVRHGGPLVREGIVKEGDPSQSDSFLFRREVFDAVIYDPEANELRIHAKKRDCETYTRAFGAHFLGDEDAFPDVDKYTLDPLRSRGADCLACAHIQGLSKITLVEIDIFYGGKLHESTIRKATDIFASDYVKSHGIERGGTLQGARFAVDFSGSKRSRFVTIQTPNKAKYKRDTDGKLVEKWLRDAGFIIEVESRSPVAVESAIADAAVAT